MKIYVTKVKQYIFIHIVSTGIRVLTFLNDAQIASKCVEVSKSLSSLESSLFTYDLRDTTTIGDAARLCVSIKNISERITERMLAAAAASLKIHYRIVDSQLMPLFESLGWVRIKRDGNKIESFVEQIPPTQDFLSTLGKKWEEDRPTVIDRATIKSVNILSSRPYAKDALVSELSSAEDDFQLMLDYGESGGYFGKFISEEYGVETIWTPHYWTSNSESVIEFLKRQNEQQFREIAMIMNLLRRAQGTPTERISGTNHY